MISISHHRQKCIGCGYCEEVAPYRWKMDTIDGKANLIGAIKKRDFFNYQSTDEELEDNLKAAELCPVKIIKVEILRK
jgi:ferredoxin